MRPDKISIYDLLIGKRRYAVPQYQRQYVWKLDEQWAPSWEDIPIRHASFNEERPRHLTFWAHGWGKMPTGWVSES